MNVYGEGRTYEMDSILRSIAQDQIRDDLPQLNIGDTVKVYVKIKEGYRERIQMFEGTIITKRHGGV